MSLALGGGLLYVGATAVKDPDERFAEVIEHARTLPEFRVAAHPEIWEATRPEALVVVEAEKYDNGSEREPPDHLYVELYRLTGDQAAEYLEHTWALVYGGWWQRRGAVEDHYVVLEKISVQVELHMMDIDDENGDYDPLAYEAFVPTGARETYPCYPECLDSA
ncbi:hypothetical protein [Nocardiopsis sp. CC223A]|uniref:hypothetical protein n=1 Tax=Nocardiopsis sp. CC223A TaxID=3044051 RepID=UPI00279620B4|nr:hypothetical protein [Nocardiopsis sp. CC223A]